MKLQKTFTLILLAVAALAGMPRMASAQPTLTLDDFSTGTYQKTLKSGEDLNFQTGTMVGGQRETDFCVSRPCSGQTNPFGQAGSFQIAPATNRTPSALIYSTGYKVLPRLVLVYGQSAALNLALAPTYDRLRLSFDGNNSVTNFLIYAFSGNSNVSTLACHIPFNPYPFTVDLPFADFKLDGGTGTDFTNISAMSLVFTQDFTVGGTDWAITSFAAIPTGAPPGNFICNNH
jgi:hypothetical protein